MEKVAILGSTGSIGVSTLDVLARHPSQYEIFALTANRSIDVLFDQVMAHAPRYAVLRLLTFHRYLQFFPKSTRCYH